MKQKYLFSMLLGSAMLASCSVDDEVNLSTVAGEANPSSPVFTIHFDNDDPLTRAHWVGDDQWKVGFDEDDLLSLYHGVNQSSATSSFTGYQNAIYKGGEDEKTKAFKFTTQALVNAGAAILVYPADTTFSNKGNEAPTISILKNQPKNYRYQTPYMSEVLEIVDYPTETEIKDGTKLPSTESNQAGYGRNYDIALKRVASTLALTLETTAPEDMPEVEKPIKITQLELVAEVGKTPFTTVVNIAAGTNEPVAKNQHSSWTKQSTLKLDKATENNSANSLTTKDMGVDGDGKDIAYFTLLPMLKKEDNTDDVEYEGNGKIVVRTNYGYVELDGKTENLWEHNNTKMTINGGLEKVLNNKDCLWRASEQILFKGESNGSYLPRTLKVDLNGLNMDGLHIEDQYQLIDVAAVLKAIGLKKNSTFYLDGDEYGMFKISEKAAYDAYEEIINFKDADEYTVTLEVCGDEGEVCDKIVLDNAAAVNGKVPALIFSKGSRNSLNVELHNAGWVLGSTTIPATPNTFVGVDSLVVADNATLELIGTVNVANPNYEGEDDQTNKKYTAATALVNRPEGTINVNDDVTLQMNTRNYGTVYVGTNESKAGSNSVRLIVSGQDVDELENDNEDKQLTFVNDIYASEIDYTKDAKGRGKIYLLNRLATTDDTNARIYNFGYIEIQKGSNGNQGSVLLYANATTKGGSGKNEKANFANDFKNDAWGANKISDLHKGDNIFGVLKLVSTTNPLTTIKEKEKAYGFVKIEGVLDSALGDANYLIMTGGETLTAEKNTPTYLEMTGEEGTIVTLAKQTVSNVEKTKTSLTGLIVPKNVTVTIPADLELEVTGAIYLKGEIYRAGTLTFTPNDYETYVGGVTEDRFNVKSPGK